MLSQSNSRGNFFFFPFRLTSTCGYGLWGWVTGYFYPSIDTEQIEIQKSLVCQPFEMTKTTTALVGLPSPDNQAMTFAGRPDTGVDLDVGFV